MGYHKRERVKVKIEFFKILTKLKIDLEKRDILVGFFQTYLQLNKDEEEMFVEEVSKFENAEEILKIPISYEARVKAIGREEGLKEGHKKGLEAGLEAGKKEVALKMLKEGLADDQIMKFTQLKKETIDELKKQL